MDARGGDTPKKDHRQGLSTKKTVNARASTAQNSSQTRHGSRSRKYLDSGTYFGGGAYPFFLVSSHASLSPSPPLSYFDTFSLTTRVVVLLTFTLANQSHLEQLRSWLQPSLRPPLTVSSLVPASSQWPKLRLRLLPPLRRTSKLMLVLPSLTRMPIRRLSQRPKRTTRLPWTGWYGLNSLLP